MIRYRIHMVFGQDFHDYIDLSGETVEEIREQAEAHIKRRGPDDYWAEEVSTDV